MNRELWICNECEQEFEVSSETGSMDRVECPHCYSTKTVYERDIFLGEGMDE